MLPKGILFDLDDTIIAYSEISAPTWRKVCEEYSLYNDMLEADLLYSTIREVSRWFWSDSERHRTGRSDLNKARRHILELVFDRLGIEDIPLARIIADEFQRRREEDLYLFEGAIETLDYLFNCGVSLAMMTNGETVKQREKIERFGLEKYFRVILIEGEQGFGKPDERVYIKAMDGLELNPKDIWAIGDNLEWDVEGPQKLGVFGIWNDYRNRGLPEDSRVIPDMIIKSICEIKNHIIGHTHQPVKIG